MRKKLVEAGFPDDGIKTVRNAGHSNAASRRCCDTATPTTMAVLFWIAFAAILLEVLGLTNTFLELHRRNRGNTAGLAPDQIAAVVHLWPSLNETQRGDLLSAASGGGISFRVASQPPVASSEDALGLVRWRMPSESDLTGPEADFVVALIRSSRNLLASTIP